MPLAPQHRALVTCRRAVHWRVAEHRAHAGACHRLPVPHQRRCLVRERWQELCVPVDYTKGIFVHISIATRQAQFWALPALTPAKDAGQIG